MRKQGLSTQAIHAGQIPDKSTNSSAVPIYQTTSYSFHSTKHAAALYKHEIEGNVYTRLANPTNEVLEKRAAAIENGLEAASTASGMAAISSTLLAITNIGDHILAADNLYGGSTALLEHTFKNLGRDVSFFPSTDLSKIRALITPKTKALYAESIANPKLEIPDFLAFSKLAHQAGIPFIVDNTIGTGIFRPIDFGADLVVISATKYIGGHGTTLGGLIVDSGNFPWDNGKFPMISEPSALNHNLSFFNQYKKLAFIKMLKQTILEYLGPTLSPFSAFQLLQGFETLPLRQQQISKNALAIAQFLEKHPKVLSVSYPGLNSSPDHSRAKKYFKTYFGGIVCFRVKDGNAAKVIDTVKVFTHLANIGDARSLILHPASTTHQALSEKEKLIAGITNDYIRLSIGLEDIEDLLADLEQAL